MTWPHRDRGDYVQTVECAGVSAIPSRHWFNLEAFSHLKKAKAIYKFDGYHCSSVIRHRHDVALDRGIAQVLARGLDDVNSPPHDIMLLDPTASFFGYGRGHVNEYSAGVKF